MKKFARTFVLLSVVLLYSHTACFYGSGQFAATTENLVVENTASGQSFISEGSPSVLAHIFSDNKANNYTNGLPETLGKSFFNNDFAVFRVTQLYLESLFSGYISSVPAISIQFRQVDIVFPFHYFW